MKHSCIFLQNVSFYHLFREAAKKGEEARTKNVVVEKKYVFILHYFNIMWSIFCAGPRSRSKNMADDLRGPASPRKRFKSRAALCKAGEHSYKQSPQTVRYRLFM